MNLIVLVIDSLRQDHVGLYHGGRPAFPDVPPCRTPSLDAFSQGCVVFMNAYPEALPTLPARYTLMTGQRSLPYRPWGPLMAGDLTLTQILRSEGYTCGLITDCYHYRAPGMNYHAGVHAVRWIRGQEYDPWESAPSARSVDGYVNARYSQEWRERVGQFLANTDGFATENDWFAPQVIGEAITWLQRNRGQKHIFLWVDCFDPHEPWDPPGAFDTYTDPGYRGPRLILPMGGPAASWASPEEVRLMRGLYAGEASFVDHWVGRFLRALGDLEYLDDSVVVVLADHGHPLGDHGKFLKGADRLYNEMLRVPFMVRLPGGRHRGERTEALVQFQDIAPTLLELLGFRESVGAMHGRSFRAVLERGSDEHREAIITGYHEGIDRCIRTKRLSLIERPAGAPDELYDLEDDPTEQRNIAETHREEAERLARSFGRIYRSRRRRATGIQGKYELSSSGLDEPVLGGR